MGLHAVAYSHMVLSDVDEPLPLKNRTEVDFSSRQSDPRWNEWYDSLCDTGGVIAYCYEPFEQSIEGLEAGGVYVPTEKTTKLEVWNHGYSTFNQFREHLSLVAHGVLPKAIWDDPDTYRYRPFYELINFADNEGTIGPVAARALAEDFSLGTFKFYQYIATLLDGFERDFYRDSYHTWTNGFDLAAQDGLVKFS